jgi:hypothetical protein
VRGEVAREFFEAALPVALANSRSSVRSSIALTAIMNMTRDTCHRNEARNAWSSVLGPHDMIL